MRADQLLVERALAPSRSAAQRLIDAGSVRWRGPAGWAVPRKAGEDLPPDCSIEIVDDAETRYASRGGLKLEGALSRTGMVVQGRNCLDLGQSTGGFTDVLLRRGARRVVGIDVGHAQLHPKLATDSRVRTFEGLNARDVSRSEFERVEPEHSFELVVTDLSFISVTLALATMARYVSLPGDLIVLVKPQFELQPADIGKGGIVKNATAARARVEHRARQACAHHGLVVHDYFESTLAGGDGNQEFFIWAQPISRGRS